MQGPFADSTTTSPSSPSSPGMSTAAVHIMSSRRWEPRQSFKSSLESCDQGPARGNLRASAAVVLNQQTELEQQEGYMLDDMCQLNHVPLDLFECSYQFQMHRAVCQKRGSSWSLPACIVAANALHRPIRRD